MLVLVTFWSVTIAWKKAFENVNTGVMTWPLEQKLLKQNSYDNHHLKLYFGQFDFHLNALSSLTSINPCVLFNLCIWFFFTYALCLYHRINKALIYKSEKYSAIISIYIIYLSRYKLIILFYKIVNIIISISQGIA